jgi:hypothetical protein
VTQSTSEATPLLIGVAGKKRSGKTMLARYLATQCDAVVAPFAAPLKGMLTYHYGILAFKPQWVDEVRKGLQGAGSGARWHNEDIFLWLWESYFGGFGRVVIPDVRFENEIEFVRARGGFTIGLDYINADDDPHESEQVPLDLCDLIIETENPYEERRQIFERALQFLYAVGVKVTPRRPKIYVASNIFQSPEPSKTFEAISHKLRMVGFEPVVPPDVQCPDLWRRRLSSLTFKEACRQVVTADLLKVAESDGLLCYIDQPSIGCTAEILSAHILDMPVAIVTTLELTHHPHLQAFGEVFWGDLDGAISWLKSMLC